MYNIYNKDRDVRQPSIKNLTKRVGLVKSGPHHHLIEYYIVLARGVTIHFFHKRIRITIFDMYYDTFYRKL